MVGKDKGKQGVVSHVIREYNAVFVDGLHMVSYLKSLLLQLSRV
jgi:ribosomal protein L24